MVLHVLPADTARGAQVYARQLCDELGGPAAGHLVVTLFAGPEAAAAADHRLGVADGRLRAAGLDPRAALRLWRLASRLRPSAVVAHGVETLKYAFPLAVAKRCPVIVYAIGTVSPKARTGWNHRLYSTLLRTPRRVVAVSSDVAEECAAVFAVPPDRLQVIPNARRLTAVPAPERDAGHSRPTIAFVGHLTDTKRPLAFVQLVAELRAEGRRFSAWMAGDGPLLDDVRDAAADADIAVLGRRNDVPDLLGDTDILVFTSRPEGEGMPGVLVEAAMAGVAVVTTDVPGARDVVADGVTGRVVPAEDLHALRSVVGELLTDPSVARRMGAAARRRAELYFALPASAQAWREVLQSV